MAEKQAFETNAGDTLDVVWDGDVWVAPSSGAQFAYRDEAMKTELLLYLRASGDEVEYDDINLQAHGHWKT